MTLKNKKIQLLGDNDTADDVIDIFDQYGSGEENSTIIDDKTSESDNTIIPETSEKKWESESFDDVSPSVGASLTESQATFADSSVQTTTPVADTQEVNVVESMNVDVVKEEEQLQKVENDVTSEELPQNNKKWEQEYENDNQIQTTQEVEPEIVQDPIVSESSTEENFTQESDIPNTIVKKSKPVMQSENLTPQEEIPVDINKKTILIVDDDVDTLEMYADVFRAADYNVLRAFDGLEAISLLGDHTPDVIFTGIVMPRMDGFTMLETIKKNERTANIPVVINSHLGRDTDKNRAKELGAKDFVIRGFTQPKEVLERVGALLLKSDYILKFDSTDSGVKQLAKDLGTSEFLKCPEGQETVIKLSITDEQKMIFTARFTCVDIK